MEENVDGCCTAGEQNAAASVEVWGAETAAAEKAAVADGVSVLN